MSRLDIKGQKVFVQINILTCSFIQASLKLQVQLSYFWTIIYFIFKKKVNFGIFFWWWSLQRGQLNKSPCGGKKTLKIREKKKLPNFIKLGPPIIFIKIYTRFFLWHFVESWAIPEFICETTFWRFSEDVYKILCYKIQKKNPHFSKICPRVFSFTPYIFIKKKYTWSINFETILWKLNISWTYSEINLAS